MSLRPLSSELLEIVKQQLNEDPKRTQETLDYLREWIQMQPHLTVRTDDQYLINFVRCSKWSMERTKERIDRFCTARTLYSDFFSNRGPFLPEIQETLKAGIIVPLPNNDSVGPTTCLIKFSNARSEDMTLVMVCKVIFMTFDILKMEDERLAISGLRIIADYKDIPLHYFLQMTPKLTKSFIKCVTNIYPFRFHSYAGVNIPDVIAKFINTMLDATVNEKTRKKITLLGSNGNELISKTIDKSILPKDFGGNHVSIAEIAAQWKAKVESYHDWFLEDSVYRSNESLRKNQSKFKDEEFGVNGTFMKLNID